MLFKGFLYKCLCFSLSFLFVITGQLVREETEISFLMLLMKCTAAEMSIENLLSSSKVLSPHSVWLGNIM